MRILHVVSTGERRGAEVFVSDLVGALNRAGAQQRVAVLSAPGGVRVAFDAPVDVLPAGEANIPWVRMNARRVRSLHAVIRRWGPEMLLAHGGAPLKYALAAAPGAGDVAVVYRRIGLTPQWMAGPLRRWAYRSLIRRARRVVAVAEAVRREMVEVFRVPPGRVVTIPNAVDHRRMLSVRGREEVRRELGIPPDAPVVLTVAALTPEKDPVSHLQAVAHVLRAVPGSRYLVAGDGPLRSAVEATVGRLGLDGRVLLLGRRDDVPDLMSASDVLLLASRTEGMPAILIEAGMAGVPSVAYAISGVPEVVEDGVTGLLAPPGDCLVLAERARLLLEDGEARRALGRAARERCRERFEIGVVAPAYVELYRQVARGGRRRPPGGTGR